MVENLPIELNPAIHCIFLPRHQGLPVSLNYSPSALCPGGSEGKASACNAGDLGLISGWERYLGEGNGYPVQCSCLENSTDRGTWWAIQPMGSQKVGHD